MQAVTVALFAVLAVASAGLIGAPVVHQVHAAPILHSVHAAPAIPIVHAAPVVTRTIVPVAQSSSFSYRAPAAKFAVPVVHAAPIVHATPVVHHAPTLVRAAPAHVVAHHGAVLVH